MKIQSIVMGLLSFLASIFIIYSVGSILSIDWLQFNEQQSILSAGFWLPFSLACIIGYVIVQKTRLG